MAMTSATMTAAGADLQELAKRHLWMHFTRHGAYDEGDVPIIVRGEGPYVWDEKGNRYLDGLSALFCVNAGHGRTELGDAAARQVAELDFFTVWSYAHPRAIELATRIASLAPGDLNRVFFTSGGSEAVESAIKLARAYHQRTGNPRKFKFISREIAYHAFKDGIRQIFVIPAEGGEPIQVTTGSEHYWAPKWSPDGRTLAFVRSPVTPDHATDLVSRDARGRWGSPRTLAKGGNLPAWAPDGRAIVTAIGGFGIPLSLEIVPVDGGERRVLLAVRDPSQDVAPFNPYVCDWSADGRTVYFIGRDPNDGILGVYGVPAAGGPVRLAVRFDDPARRWHQSGFRVFGGRFYFTVGDLQSDVWTTEIVGSR